MRGVLGHRDARLLLVGQTLSTFGDRALFLANGIWVKELTGSNAAAGLVFFVMLLPYLGAPLGGLVVDRLRRRPLMIGVDVAIGLGVLLLLFVRGPHQVWLIYLVGFLYGVAGLTFDSAQSALLTVMLPQTLLGEANGAFQTMREGVRLLAPLAGAALFAGLGGGAVAILDAATFGVSALCLARLHVHEEPAPPPEHRILHELGLGVRHVMGERTLRRLVLTVGVALLVVGFSETLVFAVVAHGLHRTPAFIGVLGSLQGVGAIPGGLTAGRALRRLGDARLVGVGLALVAVGFGAMISPVSPPIFAGTILVGFALPWVVVGFVTAVQLRTPARLQGRAYAAADAMTTTPQTISIAVGAGLSVMFDYRVLLAFMGVVVLLCAAALVAVPTPAPALAAEPAAGAEPVDG